MKHVLQATISRRERIKHSKGRSLASVGKRGTDLMLINDFSVEDSNNYQTISVPQSCANSLTKAAFMKQNVDKNDQFSHPLNFKSKCLLAS